MQHYYSEIRTYLPLYFPHQENQEFVDYLGQAYVNNIDGETHQFSFISFHMLYMSFIYKNTWFLRRCGVENVERLLKSATDVEELNTMFDLSVIGEVRSFSFLKPAGLHKNQLDKFAAPVMSRDHCAHASGRIEYSVDEVEELVEKELKYAGIIFDKTKPFLTKLYDSFLNNEEHYDPENLHRMTQAFDEVGDFIRENVLSQKDLEYLAIHEPEFLKEPSRSKEIIYKKVLYLGFLSVVYKETEIEDNLAVLNAPYLINGFDDQEDISLENLIHNEFIYMIDGFSNSDQKAFIEALGNDPANYGIE
jgi:hypothetical protein